MRHVMPVSILGFRYYLGIGKDTSRYRYQDLLGAYQALRSIPVMERTGEIASALQNLRQVVEGRDDLPVIDNALETLTEPERAAVDDMDTAERTLRKLLRGHPRYEAACVCLHHLAIWKAMPREKQ